MKKIQVIDLRKKNFNVLAIEEEMATNENCEALSLSENNITYIPLAITQKFQRLVKIDLSKNCFKTFPIEVEYIPNITKINISYNYLREIPHSFSKLKNLKKLNLAKNNLKSLPDIFIDVTNLRYLDIRNNKLTNLPFSLADTNLRTLMVSGNPLLCPPLWCCDGAASIINYLRKAKCILSEGSVRSKSIHVKNIFYDKIKHKNRKAFQQMSRERNTVYYKSYYTVHQAQNNRAYLEDRFLCIPEIDTKQFENEETLPLELPKKWTCKQKDKATKSRKDEVDKKLVDQDSRSYTPLNMERPSSLGIFGVYDGHGGDFVVKYVKKNLHKNLLNCKNDLKEKKYKQAIFKAFKETDEQILNHCQTIKDKSGSTSAFLLLTEDTAYSSWIGDSRIVMCSNNKAISLTYDHCPGDYSERVRVESLGGRIETSQKTGYVQRVNGILAVTRAFGDILLKYPQPYVTSQPDIHEHSLTPRDQFILLASDGIFDVLTNQQAVDYVLSCKDPNTAAKDLCNHAKKYGSHDNLTALIIWLYWFADESVALNLKQSNDDFYLNTYNKKEASSDSFASKTDTGGESSSLTDSEANDNSPVVFRKIPKTVINIQNEKSEDSSSDSNTKKENSNKGKISSSCPPVFDKSITEEDAEKHIKASPTIPFKKVLKNFHKHDEIPRKARSAQNSPKSRKKIINQKYINDVV